MSFEDGLRAIPPTAAIYFGFDGREVPAGKYADECEDEWRVVRTECQPPPDYALQLRHYGDDMDVIDALWEGGDGRAHGRGMRLKVRDKAGQTLLWKEMLVDDARNPTADKEVFASEYVHTDKPSKGVTYGYEKGWVLPTA